MRFQRIIEQVYFQPWYITPAAHASIHRLVNSKLPIKTGGIKRAENDDPFEFSDYIQQRAPLQMDMATGIATISILGPIGKNLSKFEKSCGCTGFEDVRADYASAIGQGAKGILLCVDSPGGTVMGTPECAAMIADCALPTVAYTEDFMCSAAYYLACGANFIVGSPSCCAGSIGVYVPWIDYADQLKLMGLNPNPVINTGGDLKALGFTGVLTDAQRQHLQESVDADFMRFQGHVLSHRDIPEEAMRGQCVNGIDGLAFNLVDQIGDLKDAKAKLLSML